MGLAKAFGAMRALAGVDLEVPPGRVAVLLGRNGAGKTTLIRILATAVLPDAGRATVGGSDVAADPEGARRRTGLVLGEDRSFYWRLSGRQNLEFFAAMHGLHGAAAKESASAAMAAVGLAAVADLRVDRYSTGMRCRLGIARALLGTPVVLLLDEPTRSLDPDAASDVRALLSSLVCDRGVAVVLATHDLHEAAALADEVVVLSSGRVVERRGPGSDALDLESAVVGAGR